MSFWLSKRAAPLAACMLSMRLELDDRARLGGCSLGDDEIAPFTLGAALHDLPDLACGIDDGRAGRVRHECGERLQRTMTFRMGGKRQHIGFLRFKASHRCL